MIILRKGIGVYNLKIVFNYRPHNPKKFMNESELGQFLEFIQRII